jgi:hypothetical protein
VIVSDERLDHHFSGFVQVVFGDCGNDLMSLSTPAPAERWHERDDNRRQRRQEFAIPPAHSEIMADGGVLAAEISCVSSLFFNIGNLVMRAPLDSIAAFDYNSLGEGFPILRG